MANNKNQPQNKKNKSFAKLVKGLMVMTAALTITAVDANISPEGPITGPDPYDPICTPHECPPDN